MATLLIPIPRDTSTPSTPLSSLHSQLQNLGFFPVEEVTIKLTVPVATRAGNRLLLLKEFVVDQVRRVVSSPLRTCGSLLLQG